MMMKPEPAPILSHGPARNARATDLAMVATPADATRAAEEARKTSHLGRSPSAAKSAVAICVLSPEFGDENLEEDGEEALQLKNAFAAQPVG